MIATRYILFCLCVFVNSCTNAKTPVDEYYYSNNDIFYISSTRLLIMPSGFVEPIEISRKSGSLYLENCSFYCSEYYGLDKDLIDFPYYCGDLDVNKGLSIIWTSSMDRKNIINARDMSIEQPSSIKIEYFYQGNFKLLKEKEEDITIEMIGFVFHLLRNSEAYMGDISENQKFEIYVDIDGQEYEFEANYLPIAIQEWLFADQ